MTKNIAESVRQRLLNLSKEQKLDFQNVLIRYGIERILYRLSISTHKDRFFLKGAMLFAIWANQPLRPTKDIDLLAQEDSNPDAMKLVFQDILKIPAPDDGIVVRDETLEVGIIKGGQQYEGLRVTFKAELAGAMIPIQIDLGFGDAVTPGPNEVVFPAMLEFEKPVLMAYPKETVIAEKFEAMIKLGMVNSRMKDFFDLKYLLDSFSFEGDSVSSAMKATFNRRKTAIPDDLPIAFTPVFHSDNGKQRLWNAFLEKYNIAKDVWELRHVCDSLSEFLMPPCNSVLNGKSFDANWTPGRGWQ
mgnify:CR=1 FL=1